MDRREFLIRGGGLTLGLATWSFGARAAAGRRPVEEVSGRRPVEDPAGRRPTAGAASDPVTLFLCGDVMTGRGIDQALPRSVDPTLHEPYVKDARHYVRLAERAHGRIPVPVVFSYPWGDALEELDRVSPDLRIANLETAVTAGGEPWPGKGIHYRMHPGNVPVLTAAGLDACVLANNHVLDWGPDGLHETLEALDGAGIRAVGAGSDGEAASSPAAFRTPPGRRPSARDAARRRILVFGFGSTTSGIPPDWAAAEDRPGVNLLPDLSEEAATGLARRILAAKGEGDLAIVSIHWGENWGYGIPRAQRAFARRLIDEGAADVVHGHSSHHAKGIEVHRDRPILYGCGDFLTDYEGIAGYERYRDDLVLMYFPTLDADGSLLRFEMTPLRLRRFRLERPPGDDARWLRETLDRESRKLGSRVEPGEEGRLSLRWEVGEE